MNKLFNIVLLLLCLGLINQQAVAQSSKDIATLSFFDTLPTRMDNSEQDTAAEIDLGKKLYFDTALSVNKTQSCNTCHNLLNNGAGVDNLRVSIGALGKAGFRNAPTTWNAGLHVAQFWDGRAKTLAQQARFPIFNPDEMAMPSEDEVIYRLSQGQYLALFKAAFPHDNNPVNLHNISKALAAFQRTLITKDRFDQYLLGEDNAITPEEKQGLNVFISKGCVACHNGAALGGQLFMKMGIVHAYPNEIDKGVAMVSGNPVDNYFFKVPSLRNILNTAPYFHDGAAKTIEQAIEDTAWHQLGITLTKEEVSAIKVFFNTLNNQVEIIE